MNFDVNVLAVIAAALLGVAFGFLWYGPLFGKVWMKLKGITKRDMKKAKKDSMAAPIMVGILSKIVIAYIIALALNLIPFRSVGIGALVGAIAGIGIVAMINLEAALWEKQNLGLFLLNMGYYVIAIIIIGMVLSVWV
ncbi:MAG TPA: DUF1761 domain-containing protein [Candidatus Nanoarchaeia archaeon]|nr:DUF1761 domain-containing protein [Candidatus Nanoarchaeia archaeon]